MFLCKDCTIDSKHWVFDMIMAISYGKCEVCGKTKECADQCSSCIKEVKGK